MNITSNMSLPDLQARMGDYATYDEAHVMRGLLLRLNYAATEDIPESDWLELCEQAAEASGSY